MSSSGHFSIPGKVSVWTVIPTYAILKEQSGLAPRDIAGAVVGIISGRIYIC